jgi:hypothetical protein
MNDFIFIQYTAGSCGKAIGVCLQTAKSVMNWSLPNIKELALMHTNDYRHVRQEPDAPYKLSWLARTYGINRGDNLKRDEVLQLLKEENLLGKEKLIINWTKIHLPQWFDDHLIQVTTNNKSLPWLIDRRKKLFYVDSVEGTVEVRYDARYHTRPDRDDRCVSKLSINELAIKQTHEELIPVNSQAHHIELHTVLNQEWNIVLEILENSIKTKLNRLWCKEYLATWHNQII